MKPNLTHRVRLAGFTLIELMIVVGIIALLAAMIFPAFSGIKRKAALKKAQTELKQLETAIGAYKTKYGVFPPDNTKADHATGAKRQYYALNALYYELKGTKLTGNSYQTLDNRFTLATAAVSPAFDDGITGFMNCTRGSSDESAPAQDFLKDLKPGQYLLGTNATHGIGLLVCSVQWAKDLPAVVAGFAPNDANVYPNPWRYNSSNPTNNVGQYDLWVDIIVSGKTNRISNWSSRPQIVYEP